MQWPYSFHGRFHDTAGVSLLQEIAGRQRIAITFIGFTGIIIMLRPLDAGFDPNGIVAVTGAIFGGVVVIVLKAPFNRTNAPNHFHYALYTTLFSAIPAVIFWTTLTWNEI